MSILSKIAKEAGVSTVTVSRVLGGKHVPIYRKAKERAQQIRAIARKLSYRPNAAARATVTGRFQCVTLLVSPIAGPALPLFPGIVEGLCDELDDHNYHLMLSRVFDTDKIASNPLPGALRENMSDGFVMNFADDVPEQVRKVIETYRIPTIHINAKRQSDCVFPDDFGASKAVTEHMIKLGHRRIIYMIPFRQHHYSNADRRAGYMAAMKNASLQPVAMEDLSREDMMGQLRALLKGPRRPTAMVGYSSRSTEALLEAASGLGLTVPRDISVVHFDFGGDNFVAERRFSTVVLPWYQIARSAAKELLEKIEDTSLVFPPLAIMPTFELEHTVLPPCSA